jgi:hypothetical protein
MDDLVLFWSPMDIDLHVTKCILSMLEKASGLAEILVCVRSFLSVVMTAMFNW